MATVLLLYPHIYSLLENTVECPSHPLLLAYLHTAECKCKCKTFLLSNSALSPKQLEFLDSTPFGVKIVKPNATMLGLHLHSPHRSVTPRFSLQGDLLSPLPQVARAHVEKAQLNTAVSRMLQRVRAGTNLGLSFRERTLFLSFYVLSLLTIIIPLFSVPLTILQIIIASFVSICAKRAWIQAKHLPGVVTYLKLGILHCPKIFLLSSMLGLCIRLYGLDIVLWLCGLTPSLPFLPKRILEGLDSIRFETLKADSLTRSPSLISYTASFRTASLHTSFLVWSPAPLNLIFYKCCTRIPDLFSVYASLKLTGWETPPLPLLTRYTQPLSKSFLPLHVLLFCDGLLIPNQTCTFASARTLLDELPVDADVAATPRYTLKVFARVLLLQIIFSIQTNGPSLVKLSLHLALIGFAIATRTPRCPPLVPLYGALGKVPLSTVLTT